MKLISFHVWEYKSIRDSNPIVSRIENLYKRKLLRQQNVLTFADFNGNKEANI